jgi:hypothetical protein
MIWRRPISRSFSPDSNEVPEGRRRLAATIPLALFGIVLARTLAVVLPFRERPLRTAALQFQTPHGLRPTVLYGWSSFPSDHAVLFVTLAVGSLMASRLSHMPCFDPVALLHRLLPCAQDGLSRTSLDRRHKRSRHNRQTAVESARSPFLLFYMSVLQFLQSTFVPTLRNPYLDLL